MHSQVIQVPSEFKILLDRVGKDFSLTQGLGGNSSYKADGEMQIKASGMRLHDVDNPNYFYRVGINDFDYFELPGSQAGKPSIEVFMHALLPQTFVLHLHSSAGVALSMAAGNNPQLSARLKQSGVALIPYCRPGEALKQAIFDALGSGEYSAFLLQNHGVLYFADSVAELEKSISRFEGLWTELLEPFGSYALAPTDLSKELSDSESERLLWQAANNWRVSPDHCVFLGETAQDWLDQLARREVRAILGMSNGDANLTVPQEQLLWFINVALSCPMEILPTLSLLESQELRGWEAEKRRVSLAAQTGSAN
jgi:ribulose-5-phosphate 4-epimerase/fuculose-1-phosphate aldolase